MTWIRSIKQTGNLPSNGGFLYAILILMKDLKIKYSNLLCPCSRQKYLIIKKLRMLQVVHEAKYILIS